MTTTFKNIAHGQETHLRVHGVEQKAKILTKGIEMLFKKIVTVSFPIQRKDMDIQVQETLGIPNRNDQKRMSSCYIVAKI
jgi:hypothetical protein